MENLKFTLSGKVGIVEFTRTQALNALNSKTFDELNHLLDEIESKREITVLILTGSGKAFIAGADIAEMKDMSSAEANHFSQRGQITFSRLENFSIPVIAAVNGFALGGGLELALSCDFIIASEKAKFSAPEVNLGLIPGFAGSQRLAQYVGAGMAKYLLFTANMVDAAEGLRIGLVQQVFPAESLLDEVQKIAQLITEKGPEAVKAVKRVVNHGIHLGFEEGEQKESEEFAKLFSGEGKEGMKAFLEKRKPNWV